MTVVYEKPLILVRMGLANIKIAPYAIDFMGLWVLFLFLLILYFRIVDDIGKTSSLFSRPCSTAL